MADFLSTGVSGLLAFQRALDTTSHNIANVGTRRLQPPARGVRHARAARVRQRLRRQRRRGRNHRSASTTTCSRSRCATPPAASAASTPTRRTWTNAEQPVRQHDDGPHRLAAEVRERAAGRGEQPRLDLLAPGAAERGAGPHASACKSYDSSSPASTRRSKPRMKSEVADITTLAQSIARAQRADRRAPTRATGQPPNDLLDQRDRLLDQLSDARRRQHGQAGRRLGQRVHRQRPAAGRGRQCRDTRRRSPTRTIPPATASRSRPRAACRSTSPAASPAARSAALLDFRKQVLDPARNALGRISVGLADVDQRPASRRHRPERQPGRRSLRRRRRRRRSRSTNNAGSGTLARHAHGRQRTDRRRLLPDNDRHAAGRCVAKTPARQSRSPARAPSPIRSSPTA